MHEPVGACADGIVGHKAVCSRKRGDGMRARILKSTYEPISAVCSIPLHIVDVGVDGILVEQQLVEAGGEKEAVEVVELRAGDGLEGRVRGVALALDGATMLDAGEREDGFLPVREMV